MNKIEKIIEKFRKTQYGHTFEDCKKVLESIGFIERSSRGSHHKFSKAGLNRPLYLQNTDQLILRL